jgi:hypothetical protein
VVSSGFPAAPWWWIRAISGGLFRLLFGLQDEVIEHELIGIELFRTAAVDPAKELLYLILENPELVLGRRELF